MNQITITPPDGTPVFHTAVDGQRIVVVALGGIEDVTIDLPAIAPSAIGMSIEISFIMAPGAFGRIAPAVADNLQLMGSGDGGVGEEMVLWDSTTLRTSFYRLTATHTAIYTIWLVQPLVPIGMLGPAVGFGFNPLVPLPMTITAHGGLGGPPGAANIGADVEIKGGFGSIDNSGVSGSGGNIQINSGLISVSAGGAAPQGPDINITASNGGTNTGPFAAGNGGNLQFYAGAGGAAFVDPGGTGSFGGNVTLIAGEGGAGSTSSGPGGAAQMLGGEGGHATLTSGTAAGGTALLVGGEGGDGSVEVVAGGIGGVTTVRGGAGGTGGAAVGGVGGDTVVDAGAGGTGTPAGVPGTLFLGTTNARNILVGPITAGRVTISRLSEFATVNLINSGGGVLLQYDINRVTVAASTETVLTLPTLNTQPSQVGMACRVLIDNAAAAGRITVNAAGGDTLLGPVINNNLTIVAGTMLVFRAVSATEWVLEDRSGLVGVTSAETTALGSGAGDAITVETDNTAVGFNALLLNTANANTAVGARALDANSSGVRNTAVGTDALSAVSTSGDCTAVGFDALRNSTGANNTAVGSGTLDANVGGSENTAVGNQALGTNISGGGNVAVGHQALFANTGNNNTAIGSNALLGNVGGIGNTAVGTGSLQTADAANNNTAVGLNALNQTTGADNTAVGAAALDVNASGTQNVAVGVNALGAATTVSGNTAVGYNAGTLATLGDNTLIGHQAGSSITSGTGNIMIGKDAEPPSVTDNYRINIGGAITGQTSGGNGQISFKRTVANLVNAAGADLINATPLTADINRVTVTAGGADGVKLPIAAAQMVGREITVINDDQSGTDDIKVWPGTGPDEIIGAGGAGLSYTQVNDQVNRYICYAIGFWYVTN
jgi:hypothetical protein